MCALSLPDAWIGAGYVRDAVWDQLHDPMISPSMGLVDVLWFDPERVGAGYDRRWERASRTSDPAYRWSVKNQARMHVRNGDRPYRSTTDAMAHWPETATAVAVRRRPDDRCDIAAPFGLDDLFALLLRPTPAFADDRRHVFDNRLAAKDWLGRYPLLRMSG